MLLQTDNMNETISTIESEKIDFTVDETALNHIMSVLTNLYSDPISSVVREITTNAFDSHLISGQTRPVEIYSPNRLSQNLVIQDFGAGMSAQDIRELYSRYGASTKRGNNIEAGQLGLGSKSPFAYTDQFTIVAVKDGEKTTAILGRNASGSAEINIVSVSSTTEGNGVKMTIPVKSGDVYAFRDAIDNFVKYAQPGLVVVDGEANTSRDSWIDLGDGFFVVESYGNSRVVMGNVAYPIGGLSWANSLSVIHYCNMGDVTFAPSREELIYNQQTKAKVEWIKDTAEQKVRKYIADKQAGATSTFDKFKVAMRYERWIPGIAARNTHTSMMLRTVRLPRYADSPASTSDMSYGQFMRYQREASVVKNFKSQRWTRLHSNKVLEKDESLGGEMFLVFDQIDDDRAKDLFGDDVKIYDWDDFRSVKVTQKTKPKKSNFEFEGFSRRENYGVIHDIRQYEKVFYISKTSHNSTRFGSRHLKKNECVVFVPPSAQENFEKRFSAEPFVEEMTRRQKHVAQCLNGRRLKKRFAEGVPVGDFYTSLVKESGKITNQEFLEDAKKVTNFNKWERIGRKWMVYDLVRSTYTHKGKYPLLSETYMYRNAQFVEHAIIYINALEEK